ncbi:MAG: hypothetical protein V2G42_00150 [bacterium JZ-2024 1]
MNIIPAQITPEGIRGIIAREWTFDVVQEIARRVASAILRGSLPVFRGIVVGYDTRFLSEKYAELIAEVVASAASTTILTEPISLPHLSFWVRESHCELGLYVTGGVLPPDYSGLVFLGGDGAYLPQKRIQEILHTEKGSLPGAGGGAAGQRRATTAHRSSYGEALLENISLRSVSGWRREIIVDTNHGTTASDFMAAFKRAGVYFRLVGTERDVLFGGRTPDLSHKEIPKSDNRGSTPFLVVAVDPTGQRLSATDSPSGWFPSNLLLPCLLRALADRNRAPFTIVRTQATTHWVEALFSDLPVRWVECPPGLANLSRCVLSENALWGLDETGCLVESEHLPVPDAVRASVHLLRVLADNDGNLSEWVQQAVSEHPPPVRRTLEFRLTPPTIRALLDFIRMSPVLHWLDYPLERATDRVGIKFVFQGGRWLYFYPRPMESRMEVIFETPDADEADPMENRILEMTDAVGVMKE